MLRKTIFWLHLTAGVIAGVVILIGKLLARRQAARTHEVEDLAQKGGGAR